MKKKFLAASVCAALVLSLAGCGDKEASVPTNEVASTSTSSVEKPMSSTPKSSSFEESKPEESSVSSQPAANPNDYKLLIWRDGYGNITSLDITYKGSDENVVYPTEVDGIPISFVDGFTNNIDIKSITIPEGIESISSGAFSDCLNLEEVTFLGEVPDFSLSSFKNTPWLEKKLAENTDPDFIIIDNVLAKADEEKMEGEVTIPDGITQICRSAFEGCDEITGVTIPDSVTGIGSDAFKDCSNITNMIIPDSVTKIGSAAFFGCKKLSSIRLPAGIKEIKSLTFANCWSLESVDVPEGVTTLGSNAFDTVCDTVVNLPDSMQYDNGSNIHTAIFKGKSYELYSWDDLKAYNSALFRNAVDIEFGDRDFIIIDNVLEKVNPYAAKIEIPDNVIKIDDNAFKDCEDELIITYKGKNYNLANLNKLKDVVNGG